MGSGPPRRFCCDEDLERIGYDGHHAADDVARWRRGGPNPATQELIEVIRADGVDGATVLDIGAGVGIIHLTLLEAGAPGRSMSTPRRTIWPRRSPKPAAGDWLTGWSTGTGTSWSSPRICLQLMS
jgi:hypothetical protein